MHFQKQPHYSEAGDCTFLFFRNGESCGDRIDDELTVYRSIETDEVVGFQVAGHYSTEAS